MIALSSCCPLSSHTFELMKETSLGSLPRPKGPYSVGCQDIEWFPQSQFTLPVLVRLYYPSKRQSTIDGSGREWTDRAKVLPSPSYHKMFEVYSGSNKYMSRAFSQLFLGNRTIWAVERAPLAVEVASMPLVIFSHGLYGIRTSYSCTCTHLASHGYLVAALEHRDGSAGISEVRFQRSPLQYQNAPGTSEEDDRKFRMAQLRYRTQEVRATIDLLLGSINSNNISKQRPLSSLRKDLVNDIFPLIRSKIDQSSVGIVGHSFGGATAMLVAEEDSRISIIVAQDPGLLAFENEHVKRPIKTLITVVDGYCRYAENDRKIDHFANRNESLGGISRILYIPRAEHFYQSNVPALAQHWTSTLIDYMIKNHNYLLDPRHFLEVDSDITYAFLVRLMAPNPSPTSQRLNQLANFIFDSDRGQEKSFIHENVQIILRY